MFTLTIEDSNGQIANRFSFDHGAYIIGRQENCDIVLPSTSVSRKHARIFVDNGRCYVEDLGSANGVVVDGQTVVKQRDLGTASQLRIGDFYLYLEYQRPEQDAQQDVLQTLFINDNADHSRLVRINDSFAGEEFTLSEIDNTIGRTDDNFILLSDPSISRHHAKIIRQGDNYTLMDLGSSNGSQVNGKEVDGPIALSPGDRVHFGNVEFVFAEGGAQINPADYESDSSGKLVLAAGVMVVLLIGLAVGGLIVFGFISMKEDDDVAPEASETLQSRVQALVDDGKSRMERKDWDGAVTSFDEVLALAPDHEQALRLKRRAEREQEASELFEQAEIMVEQGRHQEARDMLKSIPTDTVMWERAEETLGHVDKTLAYNYRNEAVRLSKSDSKGDLREAHDKLTKALSLRPDDEETLALVKPLEKKLKKKDIDFEPYRPDEE